MSEIALRKNTESRLQDFFSDAPVPLYWIRGSHQALHLSSTHPFPVHPSPVHAAAAITGGEPGEQEHKGSYDEFSHIALLARLALKGFDPPSMRPAVNE